MGKEDIILKIASSFLRDDIKERLLIILRLTVTGKLSLYAVTGSFTLAKTCSFLSF